MHQKRETSLPIPEEPLKLVPAPTTNIIAECFRVEGMGKHVSLSDPE